MPSFLDGNLAVLLGNRRFSWRGNRMTTVAFEKEVLACLAKRFTSTEVKFENLRKKHHISINGKKTFTVRLLGPGHLEENQSRP